MLCLETENLLFRKLIKPYYISVTYFSSMFSFISSPALIHMPKINNLQGKELMLIQFQRFQSMVSWCHCFWACNMSWWEHRAQNGLNNSWKLVRRQNRDRGINSALKAMSWWPHFLPVNLTSWIFHSLWTVLRAGGHAFNTCDFRKL